MSLLNMLLGSMTSQSSVESMSGETGLSQKQISALMAIALPMLIKYITKNASTPQGAASLMSALTQHTSKKPVAQQFSEADTKDGGKIVNHIFGKDTDKMIGQFSDQTGLSEKEVSDVLSRMAPAFMSGVSAEKTKEKSSKKEKGGNDLLGAVKKIL